MNTTPKTFKDLNKKAGLPEDKIREKWLGVWEESISQFLKWLIEENELNNDQVIKLKEVLDNYIEKQTSKQGILSLLEPIIKEDQRLRMSKKLAGLFVENLDNYYQELKAKESL